MAPRIIRPAPGAQEAFLSTSADIAVYGGGGGSGKSFVLLLEGARHVRNPKYRGLYFRRSVPELKGSGGLWDEASSIYPAIGGRMRGGAEMDFRWSSGASLKFRPLPSDADVVKYQGWQLDFLAFDEVTHFTRRMFEYVALSRLRSRGGIRPYVRATCNPDPDSFIVDYIRPWIDWETGYAIPEESGRVRWFVRDGDRLVWGDSPEELRERHPGDEPISFTFIPATMENNPYIDPSYRSRLQAMSTVDRERLLCGNWLIRDEVPHQIFHADRDVVDYQESTPGIDLEEMRALLPLSGGWDFGTGDSLLVCLLALVERSTKPRLWIEHDFGWRRKAWPDAADEVLTAMDGYGRHAIQYGDPTGKAAQYDQGDWFSALRSSGIPLFGLQRAIDPQGRRFVVNRSKWREESIRLVQGMLDDGRLRVHRRCRRLWGALDNWRRNVPEGIEVDEVSKDYVEPRKDVWSHYGDALLYLVSGVMSQIEAEREQGRQGAAPVYVVTDPDAQAREDLAGAGPWW
jgi:hypothetical protein